MYVYLCIENTNMELILLGGKAMEAGVRNKLIGKVEEIKADNVMAQIKMTVDGWNNSPLVTSVMTKESLEDAGFKEGDTVEALIKAINVVFVKQ